ncbi:sugar phosphate isomerase [Planctomycetota bacterium]|nr:sugar phosphate isomerase [Planctomycetota bacterium]
MPDFVDPIRLGTVVHGNAKLPDYLRQILPHGFETVQITFGHMSFDHSLDLERLAKDCKEVMAPYGARFAALSLFGNPVSNEAKGVEVREGWKKVIEHAHHFDCDLVSGFSGGITGGTVPDSAKAVAEVFKPLARRAGERGLRLAFENCPMGTTWRKVGENTAFSPAAWELLLDGIGESNVGIEWEPCHLMGMLIDPVAVLRQWAPRIFHIQGKDATIAHDVIRTHGIHGGKPWFWHRTPGFGDSNWTDLITILRQHNWKGAIDIEGWHDPVYRGELEMTGQVFGLNYLKRCRGGPFVANPV